MFLKHLLISSDLIFYLMDLLAHKDFIRYVQSFATYFHPPSHHAPSPKWHFAEHTKYLNSSRMESNHPERSSSSYLVIVSSVATDSCSDEGWWQGIRSKVIIIIDHGNLKLRFKLTPIQDETAQARHHQHSSFKESSLCLWAKCHPRSYGEIFQSVW